MVQVILDVANVASTYDVTLLTIVCFTHGRSVTEIWGRDEIQNMDLGGGGRNNEFGLLGGQKFIYGHVYVKSLEHSHIIAQN